MKPFQSKYTKAPKKEEEKKWEYKEQNGRTHVKEDIRTT
jgi:hypothetical protein